MIIDGLNWGQFTRLPHIVGLPMSEQIRAYDIYNETLIQEALLQQQYYNQEVVVPNTAGGGIDEVVEESDLPSGCIEFIYNTSDGTNAEFDVTTSGPTNYTITWGDGAEDAGEIDGGVTIEHEYADSDTEYTVRICFDNVSLVTELDF